MNQKATELVIKIADYQFPIHQTILIWLGIGVLVCGILIWGGQKLKKADPSKAPHGSVLVFEIIGEMAKNVIGSNLHEKTWKYLPFMGTVMFMMVISNLMGLFGLQPPTSNLGVNITLVLCVFILIQYTDIKQHGFIGKLKGWCEPFAALLPLNIIGDLAFPVSLCLRLFGNMLGGSIIVILLYSLIETMMPYGVVMFAITPFLHMYLDIFTAFMQTYIFFTLGSFFLAESADVNEQ